MSKTGKFINDNQGILTGIALLTALFIYFLQFIKGDFGEVNIKYFGFGAIMIYLSILFLSILLIKESFENGSTIYSKFFSILIFLIIFCLGFYTYKTFYEQISLIYLGVIALFGFLFGIALSLPTIIDFLSKNYNKNENLLYGSATGIPFPLFIVIIFLPVMQDLISGTIGKYPLFFCISALIGLSFSGFLFFIFVIVFNLKEFVKW